MMVVYIYIYIYTNEKKYSNKSITAGDTLDESSFNGLVALSRAL